MTKSLILFESKTVHIFFSKPHGVAEAAIAIKGLWFKVSLLFYHVSLIYV